MGFIKSEMKKKAIIISIKGYHLSTKEQRLIADEKPWGLILFKRNIKSFNQIIRLVKKIRALILFIYSSNTFILIYCIDLLQIYQSFQL